MKTITTITLTTAIFLMAVEPSTLTGTVIHGLVLITLVSIGAYTSNRMKL
jgi:hypothetical protein